MHTCRVFATILALLPPALPAAAAANRLIAPEVGEPVSTGIGLATYCEGNPETARWRAWSETLPDDEVRNGPDGTNSCYLPWNGPAAGVLLPYSHADGYANINLRGMWCGETPSKAELTAFGQPQFLYVRLPPEPRPIAHRGYRISVRILAGTAFPVSTEETRDAAWQRWRKVVDGDLGPGGKVLAIPFHTLGVGQAAWFEIQGYLLDGNRAYAERVVDFVSPIDC